MMTRATEHRLRVAALGTGQRYPFCLVCGGPRSRFGASLCHECIGWANRAVLRARRIALRASFAMLDGGLACVTTGCGL